MTVGALGSTPDCCCDSTAIESAADVGACDGYRAHFSFGTAAAAGFVATWTLPAGTTVSSDTLRTRLELSATPTMTGSSGVADIVGGFFKSEYVNEWMTAPFRPGAKAPQGTRTPPGFRHGDVCCAI